MFGCVFPCAYIHMLGSRLRSNVSHTKYFCNGLKVELNNEIPVSTSLSFCIAYLRFCRLRAPCTTILTLTSAYLFITSTITSFSPALYILFSCKWGEQVIFINLLQISTHLGMNFPRKEEKIQILPPFVSNAWEEQLYIDIRSNFNAAVRSRIKRNEVQQRFY